MDEGKVFAAEEADGQGGGEGISCAHGVHDGDLRGGLLVVLAFMPDERAGRSAGQGDGVQVEALGDGKDEGFLVLGESEEVSDHGDFVVVQLEDVGEAEGRLDDLAGEEALAQIDVEDTKAVRGRVLEELSDGASAFRGALGEGAEADRLALLGQQGQRRIPGDMIPGWFGREDIARLLGGIEGHCDRARRVFFALEEQGVDVLRRKGGQSLIAQLIAPHRADHPGVTSEAGGVAGEIRRSTAEVGRVRKDVPQHFAEADEVRADDFRIHVRESGRCFPRCPCRSTPWPAGCRGRCPRSDSPG
jgi:hypothetical protein